MALNDVYIKNHGNSVIEDWRRVTCFFERTSDGGCVVTAEPLEYDVQKKTITYRKINNLVPLLFACELNRGLAVESGRLIAGWRTAGNAPSSAMDARASLWLCDNGLSRKVVSELGNIKGEIHPDFWHGNIFWAGGRLVILDPIPALPLFRASPSGFLGGLDIAMLYMSCFICHSFLDATFRKAHIRYAEVADGILGGVCQNSSLDPEVLKSASRWLGQKYIEDYRRRLWGPVAALKECVSKNALRGIRGG